MCTVSCAMSHTPHNSSTKIALSIIGFKRVCWCSNAADADSNDVEMGMVPLSELMCMFFFSVFFSLALQLDKNIVKNM